MKLKVGDKVIVLTGRDKGKQGKILKTLKSEDKVIVEGVNVVKRHMKPRGNESGSIISRENPIHMSNVAIYDAKTKTPSRIGHEIDKNGKKIRVTKKSNEKLD